MNLSQEVSKIIRQIADLQYTVKKQKAALAAVKGENAFQKDELEYLRKENKKLKTQLFSGAHAEDFDEWLRKADDKLPTYMDMLLAAYSRYTNINPTTAVINVGTTEDGKTMKYWITAREQNLVAVESYNVSDI